MNNNNMNNCLNDLIDQIINEEYSCVSRRGFQFFCDEYENINKLNGDIVECGVWRGGMVLFLTKMFRDKNIWAVDSYKGCQDPFTAKYFYPNEGHVFEYCKYHKEQLNDINFVKSVFDKFNELNNPRVNFLEGYVVDTLNPKVCPINNIAVLRIDVDAYSATMEVLDYLYPKVIDGGYIIFDDANIGSAREAVIDYFKKENIELWTSNNTQPLSFSNGLAGEGCVYVKNKYK
jgi:O-methyltransferase